MYSVAVFCGVEATFYSSHPQLTCGPVRCIEDVILSLQIHRRMLLFLWSHCGAAGARLCKHIDRIMWFKESCPRRVAVLPRVLPPFLQPAALHIRLLKLFFFCFPVNSSLWVSISRRRLDGFVRLHVKSCETFDEPLCVSFSFRNCLFCALTWYEEHALSLFFFFKAKKKKTELASS